MSNSIRPHSDTEVPSYSLDWLIDLGIDAASSLGNLVSTGASQIGNLVSEIPIVGNVVGDVVSHAGAGIGNLVSGNISGGLGSLYTAADTALGGALPGISGAFNVPLTAAVGQPTGYLSSLYSGADKMLGGYLPNFGTFSQYTSPAQQAAAAAAQGLNANNAVGTTLTRGGVTGPTTYTSVPNAMAEVGGGAGGGFWDTAGKIANTLQIGGGLYSMLKGPKGAGQGGGASNQAQYRQMTGGTPGTAIRPGIQGSSTGSNAGVGVGTKGGANSRGQGANETGGLTQIRSGISESEAIMQETKDLIDDFKKFMDENKGDLSDVAKSPMEEARDKTPLTPDPYANSSLGSAYSMLR
jgi:hypothetical protein